MVRSKAARQVRGWMDVYELDDDSFSSLVADAGDCSRDAVLAVLDGRRPAFCVARAIETVTGVDAHDWFVDEGRKARPSRPTAPPESGEYELDLPSLIPAVA